MMLCPDCGSEVAGEVAFCFTCLSHVATEALIEPETDTSQADNVTATPDESSSPKKRRSWEPGISGTAHAFGRAATSSGWRRNKPETAR